VLLPCRLCPKEGETRSGGVFPFSGGLQVKEEGGREVGGRSFLFLQIVLAIVLENRRQKIGKSYQIDKRWTKV